MYLMFLENLARGITYDPFSFLIYFSLNLLHLYDLLFQ